MAKQKNALVPVIVGYDYSSLDSKVATTIQGAAQRLRDKMNRTMADLIDVGQELISVKEALPHGQFGKWLQAEFGWTERTARNFMAVAARFGPKPEMISEMQIDATAAYLLAAPSAPDEAMKQAIDRAESGEQVTTSVAREILGKLLKKTRKRGKGTRAERIKRRLVETLEHFRDRWNQDELEALASVLREFADSLEQAKRKSTKKEKG